MNRPSARGTLVVIAGLCQFAAMGQQTPHHEFNVTARRYAFEPAHLEVHLGEFGENHCAFGGHSAQLRH
jgi:hypothetical protein